SGRIRYDTGDGRTIQLGVERSRAEQREKNICRLGHDVLLTKRLSANSSRLRKKGTGTFSAMTSIFVFTEPVRRKMLQSPFFRGKSIQLTCRWLCDCSRQFS